MDKNASTNGFESGVVVVSVCFKDPYNLQEIFQSLGKNLILKPTDQVVVLFFMLVRGMN